jgi:hypothetical protein
MFLFFWSVEMADVEKASNLGSILETIQVMESLFDEIVEKINEDVVFMHAIGTPIFEAGEKLKEIGERIGLYDHVLKRAEGKDQSETT